MALNDKDLIGPLLWALDLIGPLLWALEYATILYVRGDWLCTGLLWSSFAGIALGWPLSSSCAQSQLLLDDVAPAVPQLHCGSCPLLWVYQCGPYLWAPILLCKGEAESPRLQATQIG